MSVTEEKIQELNRQFLDFMSKPENIDTTTKEIYEDLLDEVLMGFVFDVHRTTKTGSSDVEEGIPDDESYAIVDSPGLDVFGQHPVKKSQECICPNCDRSVAACRFATHLEKCMGMGRNSSRIASRRIANNSKDLSNYGGMISDDDDDVDWSLTNDNKRRRPRKDRNGMNKRAKQQKQQQQQAGGGSTQQRNGEAMGEHAHSSNENSPSNYENMSLMDKRALLTQICGVVSEHTKKLCTRSMRCPQHTDDQRKEMRANLESGSQQDNLHVDVDTYEEADGQNLREALARWDREGSSHSSPADSASTTSTSSISRKRETKSKGKGKGSKRDRGSPISQGD
ncbi:ataxin-7-like protein 3 [Odontomachus brunneus]|uniref:ataxin-7-like protein 3 n=1 Tax=Odontomachus brunneus TaxID=486640 RepID=UPI0013F1C1FD|nr:ataxin-7-like protein 3 [Odontomachus brunneus]XP_032668116.1 ataxin-7-like protein 3 [Odontomachus brunneus]XP_032668117.1 ataxin-7-like protein 3 [Odontomachus brunneus]